MTSTKRAALLAAALCALSACTGMADKPQPAAMAATPPPAGPESPLRLVASFEHQITGVTVSEDNRIFVNFPRWTDDAPISVAEVMADGTIRPYPDADWNSWRNANQFQTTPDDHFVCVQSVVADKRGSLWVVDPAAPGNEKLVAGGPKLVQISLAGNQVTRVYPMDETAAPQGAYLNDVRISPDGAWAYMTDSGSKGAIVVVDLKSGKARRVLDGDPSTQVEKNVQVRLNGKALVRPDGRSPAFAADGIALSPDGRTLYWQALTGTTLYSVPTRDLQNAGLSPKALASRVQQLGPNGVADGLLMDRKGRLYVTSPEDGSVKRRDTLAAGPATVVMDDRLRWPDTMSEGPDGAIYVTASHIQDTVWFTPGAPASIPTELFSFKPMD